MPSQIRDVRPFRGLAKSEEIFRAFRLTVTQGDATARVLEPGEGFVQGVSEYLAAQVSVSVDTEVLDEEADASTERDDEQSLSRRLHDAAAAAGVDPDDLSIVVLATSPRLRLAQIIELLSLSQVDRFVEGIQLTSGLDRPEPMQTPFSGCSVTVALCLNTELGRSEVLRPWRRGTWLARSTFRLSTSDGAIGFTPLPLTDEDRQRMGLPKGTVRYVEVESPLLSSDSSDVQLWVDAELLALMSRYPNSPAALNLQRQLFLDAMQAILLRSVQDDSFGEFGESEIHGTLLGKLLIAAGGETAKAGKMIDLSEPLELLRTDPAKVLARLENKVGKLKNGLKEALVASEPASVADGSEATV